MKFGDMRQNQAETINELEVRGDDKMKNVSDSSLHWGMVSII